MLIPAYIQKSMKHDGRIINNVKDWNLYVKFFYHLLECTCIQGHDSNIGSIMNERKSCSSISVELVNTV